MAPHEIKSATYCGEIGSRNSVPIGSPISENLTYGQSITDACMNTEDTMICLKACFEAVEKRRGN